MIFLNRENALTDICVLNYTGIFQINFHSVMLVILLKIYHYIQFYNILYSIFASLFMSGIDQ